ncbi:hypothetical protein OIU74_026139 [Salix koriyanagi]|uniref:Uncharacterized protein n=1 Tax=Salix koriyanagi TaxID=2511006 RepID=A0A9Q0W3C0_9ROSI|nr:hypothetical protein OIU74_026139 [Salix koriyanagi]
MEDSEDGLVCVGLTVRRREGGRGGLQRLEIGRIRRE